MFKVLSIILFACVVLISCAIKKSQGIVVDRERHTFYEDSINNLRLKFPADYWFHQFDKKQFLNASDRFLKYATSKINGEKAELLFASHTEIPPFHSVIGIIYKGPFQDSTYLTDLKNQIREELKIKNPKQSLVYTIIGDVIKWEYPVWNPDTKIYSTHIEFLIRRNDNLIRLLFWTIESHMDAFDFEPDNIVKGIKAF